MNPGNSLRVIAFPILGAGLYGWPLDKAIETAVWGVANGWEDNNYPNRVVFVTNKEDHFAAISDYFMRVKNDEELPFI